MTKTFSQIKKINFQKEIIRLLETKKLVSWIQVNSPTNKKRCLAMRMIATCLCMMLSFSTNLYADNITPAEALNIAKRYVNVDKKTQHKILTRSSSAVTSSLPYKQASTPYYIYNDSQGQRIRNCCRQRCHGASVSI